MNALMLLCTIEELTICCHWVESGAPEENIIEILPLKKAHDESIYSALVEYGREKNIQLGVFIGMGYDADATSSGLEFVCNQISTYNLSGHTSMHQCITYRRPKQVSQLQ